MRDLGFAGVAINGGTDKNLGSLALLGMTGAFSRNGEQL
jgi:hypothetical protein